MTDGTGVRLREGVRTCVLVFLGVRIGLSLLSVVPSKIARIVSSRFTG